MAKFKKTPQKERGTYKYLDADGKVMAELKAGVDEVTELDIYRLHQIDDQEVYYNLKSYQGLRTNKEKAEIRIWISQFIEQYKLEHDGMGPTKDIIQDAIKKKFPMKMQVLSMSAIDDDYAEDKNELLYQAYLFDESVNKKDSRMERLEELLPELTENQRWLIQKVFYEDIPQTEIAAELGITKQAVQNRLNKIYARLRKLF
ncbi:RNA polymerase sigma factor [Lactococcus petauri]|uniref:RNA polymerase sigma factor n=1 Tax=Lactococcus petauri TaxID=1940789 RepID=UPI0028913530|nr:sigma factor-like helix-turn-helix DNA-binding protein [Lactococcus petauri]MDT2558346.1 sigma factor-like helix-turn-helix DNA-binding protein [Lactococcus petauri]MDT2585820.1 sigma factor-like helix-turn-helix DNA-binding protein [Lactococcus petauri]